MKIVSIPCVARTNQSGFIKPQKQLDLSFITDKHDYALIMQCIERRVNFVSGTVCPADKLDK